MPTGQNCLDPTLTTHSVAQIAGRAEATLTPAQPRRTVAAGGQLKSQPRLWPRTVEARRLAVRLHI